MTAEGSRVDSAIEGLLRPVEVAGLRLPNRIAMAPMTRNFCPDGVPTPEVADYYVRRAATGVGLIITEGVYIDHPSAGDEEGVPALNSEPASAGWRAVVDAVHAAGSAIVCQLWHTGILRTPGWECILSPSGISPAGEAQGTAMTVRDIDAVVEAYARTARAAIDAGFDGVEVHGAHGHLLDRFMWERMNRRSDGYGGSQTNRSRFAAEVVVAIRGEIGNLPLSFRFSQWKTADYDARIADSPAELEETLLPLRDAGVSIFHPSTRRVWEPGFAGSDRTLAGWTRELMDLPVIGVGSVGLDGQLLTGPDARGSRVADNIARVAELIARGEFDIVALGRILLSNPDWVRRRTLGAGVKAYQHEDRNFLY